MVEAVVTIHRGDAAVLIGNPDAVVSVDTTEAVVMCSQLAESTFTTPTLVSWEVLAQDNGSLGADVHFGPCVTAGSPCRVRFKLVLAGSNDPRTPYSSPEQTTPHETSVTDITAAADRGETFDLYWSWSSGQQTGAYALVASAAIYIPNNGEGDFPASG